MRAGLSNKKNIALILPEMHYGGIERVAGNISRFLKECGHEVFLFVDSYWEEESFSHQGEVKIIPRVKRPEIKKWKFLQNRITLLRHAAELKKLKQQYKIDISISFQPYYNLLNMASDIHEKKILTIHEVNSFYASMSQFQYIYGDRWFFRHLYNKADKIIAVSEYCKWDLCRHMGVRREKVQIIYNSITENQLSMEMSEAKRPEFASKDIILVAGRLEYDKQQWHILHAFKLVAEECQDAILVILGRGELKEYLQNMAVTLGIEKKVFFCGFQKNVGQYLRYARLLAISTARGGEALPCIAEEALYAGVPVIAADCKGVDEVISSKKVRLQGRWRYVECGALVPTSNARSATIITPEERQMAEAMIELLKDKQKWNQISNNCKKRAKKFSENAIRKQWEDLVESI